MSKAIKIKDLSGWRSKATLYKMQPPYEGNEYVIASAVMVMFSGPETYLFAALADGEPVNMSELPASSRGTLSHAEVLAAAGYEIHEEDNQ